MRVRQQLQLSPVSDAVLALTAVVRPILLGVLYSIKTDVAAEVGGHDNIKLKMLPRLHRAGDGDCGICFEYAVHEAMTNGDGRVIDRIHQAAKLCKVPGKDPKSLLFGVEKSGAQQLIDTANEILTDDSRLLYGKPGQPVKLRRHLSSLAGGFKNRKARLALPYSIRGLWKADLFVGYPDSDRWVGTTVKINPGQLEGAAGLRIGIVPVRHGKSDKIFHDQDKNLVICPLLHDGDFMQTFYEGWRVVQSFIAADAEQPKEAALPSPVEREVARILDERREYAVIEVVEAIKAFGQPELLQTDEREVALQSLKGEVATEMMIAPISLKVGE